MEVDYNPATGGGVSKVTRNLLGTRGIDMISTTTSSGTTVAYPIYDGHGNMLATLAKNGTGYTTGNWRSYDVWGSVRSGSATGDPSKRYCASLGHQADDESDLIYMRARYYEPASGRFVCQDPAYSGANWFTYCKNDPVDFGDRTGKMPHVIAAFLAGFIAGLTYSLVDQWMSKGFNNIDVGELFMTGLSAGAIGAVLAVGGAYLVAQGGAIAAFGEGIMAISTGISAHGLMAFTGCATAGAVGAVMNILMRKLQIKSLLKMIEEHPELAENPQGA